MRGLIGIGVLCLVVAALAMLGIAVPANSLQPQPTFPEIVERLNSVNPTLKSLIVDQNALVHWMGVFHFLLRTTVYAARPALYKVIVHEAPAILRPLGDSFYMISSPEQVLADYRATSIRQDEDEMVTVELVATRSSV